MAVWAVSLLAYGASPPSPNCRILTYGIRSLIGPPTIVARATKMAGELYGRGRVLLALSDARTLDKMQEFVLRHAALNVGGVMMAGLLTKELSPYTVARIGYSVGDVTS